MNYRKVLITGGAGFIGSHLAEELMGREMAVTVIDNLSTGRWSNLDHLSHHKRLRVIVASADDTRLLEKEIPRHDFVYHLASAVGVKLIIDQPVHTVQNIVGTTEAVMNTCSKYRRPVLLTSTSEVYGKSDDIPFREDSDIVMGATSKRRWAYACAKALDEFLVLAHSYETNLPVFIVRLFNTVGPRQTGRYGMVVPTLIEQALSGRPMTVYGSGQQSRCFCSVHDVVQALARFLECPNAAGKVINIGTQEEITIMALAQTIKRVTASTSDIVTIPYEKAYGSGFDDMPRRVPELTRAYELLGWRPRTTLHEIIMQIASGFESAQEPVSETLAGVGKT
jgi:nucleoside-diphosphate-sugar epimerase